MTSAATPAAKAINSLFLARIPAAFDGKGVIVSVVELAGREPEAEVWVIGAAVVLSVVLA